MKNAKYLSLILLIIITSCLSGCFFDKKKGHNNKAEIASIVKENLSGTAMTMLKQHTEAGKASLVYIYAEWCPNCRNFTPIFDEFAAAHTDIVTEKLNYETIKDLAKELKLETVPAIYVFDKDGKYQKTILGTVALTELNKTIL